MIRSRILQLFSLYKPLRPLLAQKTLIYKRDPTKSPNPILFALPSAALLINNVLLQWSWLNFGGLALVLLASRFVYNMRKAFWSIIITQIETDQAYHKLFINQSIQKKYGLNISEQGQLIIDRSALVPNKIRNVKAWPQKISEVNMNTDYVFDILSYDQNGQIKYSSLLMKLDPTKNKIQGYDEYIRALIAQEDMDTKP